MQVVGPFPELPLVGILAVLGYPDSLPEDAVDVFDPPLALAVVDDHLDLDDLIWEEYELVHVGLDAYIVRGLHAREAAFALHATLEVEMLVGVSLDGLADDVLELVFFCVSIIVFLDLLHV